MCVFELSNDNFELISKLCLDSVLIPLKTKLNFLFL